MPWLSTEMIDQREGIFDAAVVTAVNAGVLATRAEHDPAPRDTDPLTGAAAVAAVEEDHLHSPPVPVDHAPAHGVTLFDLHKRRYREVWESLRVAPARR